MAKKIAHFRSRTSILYGIAYSLVEISVIVNREGTKTKRIFEDTTGSSAVGCFQMVDALYRSSF